MIMDYVKNAEFELKFANALYELGLDYNPNTLTVIRKITKEEEPDFEVLMNIVNHNRQALNRILDKGDNYVFVTLKNMIVQNYGHEKVMLLASEQRQQAEKDDLNQMIYETVVKALFDLNIVPIDMP